MSFIEIKNVTYQYPSQNKSHSIKALDDISLNIDKGEFVTILGHNGCGKSTLAKLLNGIFLPTKGKVFIDGMDTTCDENIYDIRSTVGLVLQNPDNQIVTTLVEEDVAFGGENLGLPSKEIRQRVDNALKTVGMYEYRLHDTYRLSGGQKQKIAIAGILAMEPLCIVLDEPTAMLDTVARIEIFDTIKKLNKEKNITIILVTHYMEEAVQSDRVIVMDSGKISLDDTPNNIFSQVGFLKSHHLDIPQGTELIYKLKSRGYNIKPAFSVEECVVSLSELLRESGYEPIGSK